MITKKIIVLIMIIFCSTIVFSEDYYADLTIIVNQDGSTELNGTTNYFELNKTTQEYTSKQGEKWIFDFDSKEVFSEFVYEIVFPENTEIQKIETQSNYRITTNNNRISIIGFGNNSLLQIKINYIIKPLNSLNFFFPIIIIIIFLITISTFFLIGKKKDKNKNNEKFFYNKAALTERQLEIMNLIEENNGQIIQSEIQKKLNYSKAAISRNLKTLEKKDIIKKERKGMTMLITIRKKTNNYNNNKKN